MENEDKKSDTTKDKKPDTIEIKIPKLKIPKVNLERIRKNPWIISTIILGTAVLFLLFNSGGVFKKTISGDDAGKLLLNFYESNGITGLSLNSIEEVSGLYRVNFGYKDSIIPIYITKDGKFIGALNSLEELGLNKNLNEENNAVEISSDDDPVIGEPNAPVTIVEFSDFQCPFCAKFINEVFPGLNEAYIKKGKVKLVYRDFPLDFHQYAQKAAEAAECVDELGGDEAYFKMHDQIFKNQQAINPDNLKKWAKEIGYDIPSCLDSGQMKEEVEKDFEDGKSYGISGTPGFFINGRLLSGAQPINEFNKIIDEELAKIK